MERVCGLEFEEKSELYRNKQNNKLMVKVEKDTQRLLW
jgi:hypothetical protein